MNNQLLLETAIKASLDAGKVISDIYHDPASDFEVEKKADNSPLTIADRKSNDMIISYLKQTPYPIISEECKNMDYAIRKEWETVWVVDPLDGTKEFIKRNGEFTVNIALVRGGHPVLGVIYIPEKRVLYYGTLEGGAYRVDDIDTKNGADFAVIENRSVKLPLERKDGKYIAVASRSHMSAETESYINTLKEQHGDVSLTSIGSSIKICLVAEGSADIYPRFAPTMEWDTAAGHAIVRAAGKEMYQVDEVTPLRYNKEDLLNPWFIVRTKRD